MSFRARLTLVAAAAVALAVVLASIVVWLVVRNQMLGQFDKGLRQRAEAIYHDPEGIRLGPSPFTGHVGLDVHRDLLGVGGYIQLVTGGGRTYQSFDERGSLPVSKGALEVAQGKRRAAFVRDTRSAGTTFRVFTMPVQDNLGRTYALQVAQDLGDSRVSRPLQVLRRHHLDWAGCLEVSALDHGPRDHYLLELLSGGCLGGHLRLRCDGADGGDHRGGDARRAPQALAFTVSSHVAFSLHRGLEGPVLLVLAARPAQSESRLLTALEEADRHNLARRIELTPLSVADAATLLGSGIERTLRDALYRESGGNPLERLPDFLRLTEWSLLSDVDRWAVPQARARRRVPELEASGALGAVTPRFLRTHHQLNRHRSPSPGTCRRSRLIWRP